MGTVIVGREIRKRGFFGWLFLLIFYAFNLLMLAWLVIYWSAMSGIVKPGSTNPEQVGATIGATIGTGLIFFFWVAGAVITGLFVLLTRGKRIYVEEIRDVRLER